MGEVFFIRHGQASYGAENYDKLSALGHQQSEWLGQHLADTGRFDAVISGTLTRHLETLAGIQRTIALPSPRQDCRLNEMSYFTMEQTYDTHMGKAIMPTSPAALEMKFAKVLSAWQAGEIDGVEESFQSFEQRVVACLVECANPGKRVLIVSSGGPVGVVMRHILGLGLAAMTEVILGTHNASVTRLMVSSHGLRLQQYNSVPHLDRGGRRHALTYL